MKLYFFVILIFLFAISCKKDHAPDYSIDGRWNIVLQPGEALLGTDNWIEFHPDICCITLSYPSHAIITGTYDESYQVEFLDTIKQVATVNRPFFISHDTLFSLFHVTPGGIKIYSHAQFRFYDHGHELDLSDGQLLKR